MDPSPPPPLPPAALPPTALPPAALQRRVLVLFGSQTGNAERLAERIRDRIDADGTPVALFCLDQVDKRFSLASEQCVVVVTSTHYDGDPPDNAAKFWRGLRSKSIAEGSLAHLHFAVLGA